MGSTARWQKSHATPSRSVPTSPLPSVGVLRPRSHPMGEWQRMQMSPADGASCSATATQAKKSGSRAACPIMLPSQACPGSVAVL